MYGCGSTGNGGTGQAVSSGRPSSGSPLPAGTDAFGGRGVRVSKFSARCVGNRSVCADAPMHPVRPAGCPGTGKNTAAGMELPGGTGNFSHGRKCGVFVSPGGTTGGGTVDLYPWYYTGAGFSRHEVGGCTGTGGTGCAPAGRMRGAKQGRTGPGAGGGGCRPAACGTAAALECPFYVRSAGPADRRGRGGFLCTASLRLPGAGGFWRAAGNSSYLYFLSAVDGPYHPC